MAGETKRQRLEALRAQLENERSSFLPHWRDLGDYILPRRPRFVVSDINKGERRNFKIIDSTATLACRTLRSGMMGGVTSPARPWFALKHPKEEFAEVGSVKTWLHRVSSNMTTVFLKSNLYQALPMVYGDLSTFGTAAMMIEEDFAAVIRFHVFPIGSYSIGTDSKGKVNIFSRDFRMTVRQIVGEFAKRNDRTGEIDWANISEQTRTAWDNNNREQWVDVCHVIMPNDDYRVDRIESKYKKFSSTYYEKNSSDQDVLLSEKGYDLFPVMVPRWEVTGEDFYGTECPGMTSLGDIKQVQLGEKRIAQAIEKMINPPMKGPSTLLQRKTSILPGDFTADDSREGQKGFSPVHEVNPRVQELEAKQEQIRQRIRRAFFEDLFLMFEGDDRSGITATEISTRREEKLLVLGSVLEQLNQDLLDPLIDNTFAIMARQSVDAMGRFAENGLVPPPPPEVAGVNLKVEYISVMAQAQKLVGIGGIERFIGFALQVATAKPEVMDKVDIDQTMDIYGDITGLPPGVIRPDDEVESIREQNRKAMQAQQMVETVNQGAQAAKNLSQADTSGDNALTQMIESANAGNLMGAA